LRGGQVEAHGMQSGGAQGAHIPARTTADLGHDGIRADRIDEPCDVLGQLGKWFAVTGVLRGDLVVRRPRRRDRVGHSAMPSSRLPMPIRTRFRARLPSAAKVIAPG
jgi:hypothetical protein